MGGGRGGVSGGCMREHEGARTGRARRLGKKIAWMSVIACRRVQSGYVTNSTLHFLPTTEVTLFLETHTEIKQR